MIHEMRAEKAGTWSALLTDRRSRETLRRIASVTEETVLEEIVEGDSMCDALRLATAGRRLPSQVDRSVQQVFALRGRLVSANLGIVGIHARRHSFLMEYDDLFQEGTIGLFRAVHSFDPDLGFTFATYAMNWIRHKISRHTLNHRSTIRVPVHAQDKHLKGDTEKYKCLVESARHLVAIGTVEARRVFDPFDGIGIVESADEGSWLREVITSRLAANPALRSMVLAYYGFDGEPRTLKDVGRDHGLSGERVRQLLVTAYKKIEPALRDRAGWELIEDTEGSL